MTAKFFGTIKAQKHPFLAIIFHTDFYYLFIMQTAQHIRKL